MSYIVAVVSPLGNYSYLDVNNHESGLDKAMRFSTVEYADVVADDYRLRRKGQMVHIGVIDTEDEEAGWLA